MSQRVPCPFCGNLSFEEENGILICTSCGRQQDGGMQVDEDDADFGTQGKITRKKVEKTKVKVTKVYHGAQAYRLYLQAWQHILWRQTYAMIHGTMKAPTEMWTVVKDLWTLRLTKLVQRLDSNSSDGVDIHQDEGASTSEDNIDSLEVTKNRFLTPKLWDTISLAYLSLFLLRYPITLNQLYRLIRIEEVPFIRAIRHVPIEISSKLPSEYQLALDTTTIPATDGLRRAIYHALNAYATDFGMAFPPLNWRPMLFEWIRELGVPTTVYPMVKELADIVMYDFTYQALAQQRKEKSVAYLKTTQPRRSPVAMAEVQLMSLIIVSVKLCFPFEISKTVRSLSGTNPSANSTMNWPPILLDWSAWLRVYQSQTQPPQPSDTTNSAAAVHSLQPGKEIEVTDRDILNMSPDQLDSYMDWYQRTYTTPESVLQSEKTELEKSILDMFPLSDLPEHPNRDSQPSISLSDRVSQFQSQTIRPGPPRPDLRQEQDTIGQTQTAEPAPGSQYQIFPTAASLHVKEDQPDNENPVLAFHTRAAELVCLDISDLLRAVRHTERKLEKWVAEQKRKEAFGGHEHEPDEMEEE